MRPVVSRADLRGTTAAALVQSTSSDRIETQIAPAGASAQVRVYDARTMSLWNVYRRSAAEFVEVVRGPADHG